MLWDTRFKNHPLWSSVARVRETMNRIPMPATAEDREMLAHAGMVLELLEKRRDDTDGREVSPAMLATTNAATETLAAYLANLEAGAYTWSQVIPMVDEVVNTLGQWPPMKIARWLSGMNAAVTSFEDKTAEAIDRTTSDASVAIARTAGQATEVEQAVARLAEQVGALGADVARERQRISEAIATFTTEGQDAVRSMIAEQQERIATNEAEWSTSLAAQQAKADEHDDRMASYEEKSIKVLGAVGRNSTATDYGVYSNAQHDSADRWRLVAAAVFGVASIWFVVSSLPWFIAAAATWESSLSRLGVTAAVAGVGAYAARESSQHRKQEREAKKVQLVLTALEPFIANLPAKTQDEIRAEAARAIFVITVDSDDDASTVLTGSSFVDLARTLMNKVPDAK